MALGALIIKEKLGISDRETVEQIKISGPPLGRPPKNLSKKAKKQAEEDEKIRNEIEGKFGIGKRRFSLNRVMAKLDQTSLSSNRNYLFGNESFSPASADL